MNFIKKIFDKEVDYSVHLQFQKFSKGEFRDRAIISARQSSGKFSITTSAEFANELVRKVAEKLGDKKTKITGAIISTSDLTGELEFKEKKQFQGVKRYIIDNEMSGKEIINLIDKFPKNFFALSFEIDETKLKIKPKAPKSAKAKNKEETPKPDFCRLKTKDKDLGESFVFEKPDFKQAEIVHSYLINEIIIPNELKNEKDFAKLRGLALRKGVIIRKAKIDGKEIRTELEFEA